MTGHKVLLNWYRSHRRDLPWRGEPVRPYEVLLSEIMLQQTRVETVVPYFCRFLEAFPTVEALAAADVEDVLARWSGLGYYRRARNLHAAAREVVALGGFPGCAEDLQTLPGIGPYTAAAVASIAFGEAVAVVDGNVERVASRYLALSGDPKRGDARKAVRELAQAWLDPSCPGDSNQALMELGALVCRPRAPACAECPVRPGCRGHAAGIAAELPRRGEGRPTVMERRIVALVEASDRVLLFRNAEDADLLAGLWELPSVIRAGRARRGWETALGHRFGGRWRLRSRVGTVRHAITHRRIDLSVHRAALCDDGAVAEGAGLEAGWFSRAEIAELPTTSMVTKVLEAASPAGRR